MDIGAQFNMAAEGYDKDRRKFIPCFDDFYEDTTAFLAANITQPKLVTDLGAGTGLLTYFWQKHFPDTKFVLADIADDMLNVARRRFEGNDKVSFIVNDYCRELPDIPFDTAISALSIHHLEHEDKQTLFDRLYKALPAGGLFVNYDQFCGGTAELDRWYDSYWEGQLYSSGISAGDIALWEERRKLDRECTVEEECAMLEKSGFGTVKCIYAYRKFAVIAAIK